MTIDDGWLPPAGSVPSRSGLVSQVSARRKPSITLLNGHSPKVTSRLRGRPLACASGSDGPERRHVETLQRREVGGAFQVQPGPTDRRRFAMQNLTRASEELFRRGPDECFATFDALWQQNVGHGGPKNAPRLRFGLRPHVGHPPRRAGSGPTLHFARPGRSSGGIRRPSCGSSPTPGSFGSLRRSRRAGRAGATLADDAATYRLNPGAPGELHAALFALRRKEPRTGTPSPEHSLGLAHPRDGPALDCTSRPAARERRAP